MKSKRKQRHYVNFFYYFSQLVAIYFHIFYYGGLSMLVSIYSDIFRPESIWPKRGLSPFKGILVMPTAVYSDSLGQKRLDREGGIRRGYRGERAGEDHPLTAGGPRRGLDR